MTRIEVQMKLAENSKWNILQEKLMHELRQHVEKFDTRTQWHMARKLFKQTKIHKAGSCIVPSERYK
jgi:hypothetical protein